MTADALSRIRARGHIGIRLGLDRMRALLAGLDDPQRSLRGALIGGTNGKGSVAAMVASILQAHGVRTSQAPSPHLSRYEERIIIDGQPIARHDLDRLLDEVLRASEPGEAVHGPATEFELLMAAAFLWSARQGIDAAIIEVGLGGRLDASNTWDAPVSTITNVGLDHQVFLGDTVEEVAAEKAAIIKPHSHAVTGADGAALRVIAEHAQAMGAPLAVCSPLAVERHDLAGLRLRDERLGTLHLPMLGRHQAANAAVALGTVAALAAAGIVEVNDRAIRSGLARARWPGRLELLEIGGVHVLLDGAHNPDGASALAAAIDELQPSLPAGRLTLVLGVLADKDVRAIIGRLRRSAVLATGHLIATSVPETERSLSAAELAEAWGAAAAGASVELVADPDEAIDRGRAEAARAGGLLLITGSLYLVGHARLRLLEGPPG